jgi:hypothetical protein
VKFSAKEVRKYQIPFDVVSALCADGFEPQARRYKKAATPLNAPLPVNFLSRENPATRG